jgi:hypothetical protein
MSDTSLAAQIQSFKEQRANLTGHLLTDSLNPRPSYSVGGQSVSRTEWRKSILDQIKEINTVLGSLDPVEIISIGV